MDEKVLEMLKDLKTKTDSIETINETIKSLTEQSEKVDSLMKEVSALKAYAPGNSVEKSLSELKVALLKSAKGIRLEKDYAIGSNGAGGYFIPTEIATIFGNLADQAGVARQISQKYVMSQNKVDFPKAGATTAGIVGEGQTMLTNSSTITKADLDAVSIGNIVKVSYEFAQDARPTDLDFLMQMAVAGMTDFEDDLAFIADGSATYGSYTGLLNNSSINSVVMGSGDVTFAALPLDDLSDMISNISSKYQSKGSFVFHPSIRGIIRGLLETGYGYTWKANGMDVERIWGYPVYYSDRLPGTSFSGQTSKAFGVFGDFNQHIMGIRSDLTIKFLAETFASSGQNGYQFIERAGFTVLDDDAFCKIVTAGS